MNLICPECKNQVDLSRVLQPITKNHAIECNHCGISLLVLAVTSDAILTEVMDEGK